MAHQRRWVLTGASGWFGRNALWEYEQIHGPKALRRDVIACASTARPIEIGSPYGPVQAVALEELGAIDDADGLIHLAFLTRERLATVGLDRYITSNRAITAQVAGCIARNPGMPIITTSSGAAAVFDGAEVDLSGNPYAALKQEEEELWRRSGVEHMATVFRVYAATGRFIKNSKVFALVDFLRSALAGERIEIRSKRQVIRSYVHIGTMMRLFWAILAKPDGAGFKQVDAVIDTFTLVDLAKTISEFWGLPEPRFCVEDSLPADDYQADKTVFLELLKKHDLAIPTLIKQLQETAYHIDKTCIN